MLKVITQKDEYDKLINNSKFQEIVKSVELFVNSFTFKKYELGINNCDFDVDTGYTLPFIAISTLTVYDGNEFYEITFNDIIRSILDSKAYADASTPHLINCRHHRLYVNAYFDEKFLDLFNTRVDELLDKIKNTEDYKQLLEATIERSTKHNLYLILKSVVPVIGVDTTRECFDQVLCSLIMNE